MLNQPVVYGFFSLFPLQLRRDPACETQRVEADEAGGGVRVAGFGFVFHRRYHSRTGAGFTHFSFVWLSAFLPARRESLSAASAVRVAAVADRGFP